MEIKFNRDIEPARSTHPHRCYLSPEASILWQDVCRVDRAPSVWHVPAIVSIIVHLLFFCISILLSQSQYPKNAAFLTVGPLREIWGEC